MGEESFIAKAKRYLAGRRGIEGGEQLHKCTNDIYLQCNVQEIFWKIRINDILKTRNHCRTQDRRGENRCTNDI